MVGTLPNGRESRRLTSTQADATLEQDSSLAFKDVAGPPRITLNYRRKPEEKGSARDVPVPE